MTTGAGPGFHAEQSLYRSTRHYRTAPAGPALAHDTVVPQIPSEICCEEICTYTLQDDGTYLADCTCSKWSQHGQCVYIEPE